MALGGSGGGKGDSVVAQGTIWLTLLPAPAALLSLLAHGAETGVVPPCWLGKGPAVTSVPSLTQRPAMELLGALSPPWWLLLFLLLALLLWATRRSPWEPHKCPTDLTGRTVIVTGANSGEQGTGGGDTCGVGDLQGTWVSFCLPRIPIFALGLQKQLVAGPWGYPQWAPGAPCPPPEAGLHLSPVND